MYSGWHVHGLRGKTGPISSWLHLLKSWSILKIRGDSVGNAHASVGLLDEPNDLLAVYLLLRIALPLGCTDSSTLPWYGLQVAGCRSSACHAIFSALVAFAYINAIDNSSHIE
jgi:hypothetical protein